ncbi:hypothetical protein LCGC14_0568320 [marine sediment metagenome]|uniref:Uncharacterized protein n=1 Tax=marine sediment metagenome TaxID=412755 RepID=A0A0F9RJY4_9ZZZZ
MEKIKIITVREYKARLSHYMCLMRDGECFRVGGTIYGMKEDVTELQGKPFNDDLSPNEDYPAGISHDEELAVDPVMALCSNCKEEWDIAKTPCYETWNETTGENVIICDVCVKFKAGSSQKMYKSFLKNMTKL